MANLRPPEYGVKKDELTLTSQDPAAVMYGVTPDNKWIPIKVTDAGELVLGSSITLEMSDMQIGAVELKNYNTDDRVFVSPDHEVLTQARLYDAAGTGITSTAFGPNQALDINVVGGTTISASTDEDDSVPAGMQLATLINLTYGYDGIDWQRINSTSGRLHVDGSGVTQPISAASLPLPTGAATELTLTAIEADTSNLDVLLSTRATEATLAGIKAQTDLFNFTGTALDVNIASGVTLEVNLDNANDDVLVYGFDGAVNRAIKTDAAGELQVDILSSALPTGAATEATLSAFHTDFNAVDFATEATLASIDSTLSSQLDVLLSTRATEVTLATRASEATLSGFRTDFNAVDFATETTLLAVNTNLDQFTFTGGSVDSNITNATLAVTQSGAWSVGRTWTLASGSDSVSAVQSGTWNINNISGTVSLPTGAATEATLNSIKTQTDQLTFASTRLLVDGSGVTQPISAVSLPLPTGAATEATLATRLADATFTGRINTLGQKTMANSTPVVLASDQSVIVTRPQNCSTGTTSSVASSITVVTLLAANSSRRGATIQNDSTRTLFVKLGSGAALTDHTVRMISQAYYEVPFWYDGIITGIWDVANGNARVTELT